MKTTKLIKIAGVLLIAIIIVLKGYHYISYGKVIENKESPLEVTENKDFESLGNKDEQELQQLGFSEKDINTIKEINSRHLTLNGIIAYLEDYDNQSVNPDDLIPLEFNLNSERNEGNYVEIGIEPVQTFYMNGKNDKYKTFYTKIYYTVNIKEPMVFQSQDKFQLDFNEWYHMFGYAKIYYVSNNGEKHEEFFSTKNKETLEFDVRKKVDGATYYLSGISGIYIIKSLHHLSLYAEYNHTQLIRNKPIKQYWATWD